MSEPRRLRICLAASAGGHLSQLLKLRPVWQKHECFFVTTAAMVAKQLERDFAVPVYVVVETNRDHPMKVIKMLFQTARAVFKHRPDLVLSTGAAPGCLACLLGKLVGAKVVWVDSIANAEKLSLSGRLVRPLADLFLTQWSDLADAGRRVEYAGELM